jgi:malate dehydrogenase (oxaloacetate-decarboxylating)(NADP+)
MFLAAARTLAGLVGRSDLEQGALYPPLRDIRRISLAIAVTVAAKAHDMGLARARRPRDLRRSIAAMIYQP